MKKTDWEKCKLHLYNVLWRTWAMCTVQAVHCLTDMLQIYFSVQLKVESVSVSDSCVLCLLAYIKSQLESYRTVYSRLHSPIFVGSHWMYLSPTVVFTVHFIMVLPECICDERKVCENAKKFENLVQNFAFFVISILFAKFLAFFAKFSPFLFRQNFAFFCKTDKSEILRIKKFLKVRNFREMIFPFRCKPYVFNIIRLKNTFIVIIHISCDACSVKLSCFSVYFCSIFFVLNRFPTVFTYVRIGSRKHCNSTIF